MPAVLTNKAAVFAREATLLIGQHETLLVARYDVAGYNIKYIAIAVGVLVGIILLFSLYSFVKHKVCCCCCWSTWPKLFVLELALKHHEESVRLPFNTTHGRTPWPMITLHYSFIHCASSILRCIEQQESVLNVLHNLYHNAIDVATDRVQAQGILQSYGTHDPCWSHP